MTNYETLLDLYKALRLEALLWEAEKELGVYDNDTINPIL